MDVLWLIPEKHRLVAPEDDRTNTSECLRAENNTQLVLVHYSYRLSCSIGMSSSDSMASLRNDLDPRLAFVVDICPVDRPLQTLYK